MRKGRSRPVRAVLAAAAALLLAGCESWYNRVPSPDDLWYRISWFDHMIHQRSVHPYSRADIPRHTVDGTVPTAGGEPDWSAEFASGNRTTADRLQNPLRGVAGTQDLGQFTARQGSGSGVPATGAEPAGPAAAGDTGAVAARGTQVPAGGTGRRGEHLPAAAVPVLPGTIEARGDTLYSVYCAVCHGETGDGKGPVGPMVGAPSILTPQARGYTDGYLYSIVRYGRGVMPRYGDKIYAPLERWAVVNHVRKLQGQGGAPADTAAGRTATPTAAPAGGQQ